MSLSQRTTSLHLLCHLFCIHRNTARPRQALLSRTETAGVLLRDVEQMRASTHPIPPKETAKAFVVVVVVVVVVVAVVVVVVHFLESTVLSIWCSPECSESCLTKNREVRAAIHFHVSKGVALKSGTKASDRNIKLVHCFYTGASVSWRLSTIAKRRSPKGTVEMGAAAS